MRTEVTCAYFTNFLGCSEKNSQPRNQYRFEPGTTE